jgi:hypothetical protein
MVLAMAPMMMALWSWPGIHPAHASGAQVLSIHNGSTLRDGLPDDDRTTEWTSASAHCQMPSVLLSVEPGTTKGETDGETSVVFPGYLLPDDTREEPPHEGS